MQMIEFFMARKIIVDGAGHSTTKTTRRKIERRTVLLKKAARTVIHSEKYETVSGSAYGSRTRVPALRGLCPNH
jgi:hypothetical protein